MADPTGSRAACVLPEADHDRLMRAIQAGVPLVPEPFERLAAELSLAPADVLAQLRAWSEAGILREISAVLEGSALGYESALATGRVAPERLPDVVACVNAHPTVTHDYLRDHDYNLWFTIAVPARMGVDATLALLARECGVGDFHALRRTATFKIGVNFDPATLENRTGAEAVPRPEPVVPVAASERDMALFRALQTPLPLEPCPFGTLADAAGSTIEELMAFAEHHRGGALRRYVGTLRHRKLGVRANGMAVWAVDEPDLARVGSELAGAPEVSHCYARNPIPGFFYNLYSMLHGPDRESCRAVAARLAETVKVMDYTVLFSIEEYKKTRLRYFLPELDAWWAARAASGRTANRETSHRG